MPRFIATKWKPVDDTTPGLRTVDPRSIVLRVAFDPGTQRMGCPCGCAEMTQGKSLFRMGHDARFRGKLIRAYLTGTPVRYYIDDVLSPEQDPYEIAKQYSWASYLDAAAVKREGKNRELLREAMGSDRLVRVGRWDYTGQVVAVFRTGEQDMYRVRYVDRAGETRTVKVPASEAPAA